MQKQVPANGLALAQNKLQELKKLVEQRHQVHVELLTKIQKALEKAKVGGPLPSTSLAGQEQKGSLAKRPSMTPAPDPKRQRVDDVDRRINEVWNKCGQILRNLKQKGIAAVFNRPVDPKRDGVPDYFNWIKHPMDLGTVQNKLRERQYKDPHEFAADVRLVWANCKTYNQPNTPVRNYGDQLSEEWERRWAESQVEAIWDDLSLQKDPQSAPLDRKLAVSARQLIQRVNSIQSIPVADPSREMTMVEKRKLSLALADLQGEQLSEVLNIIAESLHHVNPEDEEEIELDIDSLDNDTLWKLRAYVDGVRNKLAGRPGVPGPGGVSGGNSRPPMRTESGSESDRYSAEQDVKGSNMVEQPQSQPQFIKNQRSAVPVDESVTAPNKDKSSIATDKKSNKDVVLNESKWDVSIDDAAGAQADAVDGSDGGQEEDALWDSFRSVAEKEKLQKAEEDKRRKELEQERERQREQAVAEARRAKEEEERKMKEAEDAAAAEEARRKEEVLKREMEELQKEANTAQVYRPPDATTLDQLDTGAADMTELGLAYKHDEDDADGFDD